jgi:RimJ/RimL family protein N-acetyltransferase
LPQDQPLHQARLLSYPDQTGYEVTHEDETLRVHHNEDGDPTLWQLSKQSGQLTLAWAGPHQRLLQVTELLAAIEASFTCYPHERILNLAIPVEPFADLFDSGVLIDTGDKRIAVYATLFWQQARIWRLPAQSRLFPLHYKFTHGQRHPLRPPKPAGIVYRRYISWLDGTLTFRTLDTDTDLVCFNRWMNDPDVAAFWQETGDFARHRAYLEGIQADPHVISLLVCLDDEPFGYFEIYWAKENRIAPFYDADDFDRGWHVLIGEPHRRGRRFVTAWLPSISHYLFLDDARTRRIVIEPRADNRKMIRNLTQCGYANLKEFDFPHKRAMLGMLLRERFFAEQLWVPRNTAPQLVSLS